MLVTAFGSFATVVAPAVVPAGLPVVVASAAVNVPSLAKRGTKMVSKVKTRKVNAMGARVIPNASGIEKLMLCGSEKKKAV